MTTQMEHRQDSALELSPGAFGEMVDAAHEKAKVLADIVEKAKLYVTINGRQYLQVEAWQTIGRAYGYTAKTGDVQVVRDPEGNELGIVARSTIYDASGQAVGGAEGYCMNDEKTWAGREFYARAGMAQTRSISRGFRQLLSWVVVLAGYAPTPAEEMTGDERPLAAGQGQDAPYGVCDIHKVAYFKSPRMRSPAHKTDTGEWCNKPAEKPVAAPVASAPAAPRVDLNTGQVLDDKGQPKAQPLVDHLAAWNAEQRRVAQELGYKTPNDVKAALGAHLDEWLAADKMRTPAEAIRVLREAKNRQGG